MEDNLEHLRIALVGAGRVGTAVATLLMARDHRIVGVASRSAASARRGADRLGSRVVTPETLPDADLVLIGAPDLAIESATRAVAPALTAGAIVVHFAGSLGLAPLKPAIERGCGACALHPVQACPDVDTAVRRLPGSAWGVTCSSGLEQWVEHLISGQLGGVPVVVEDRDRPRWHAAAAITSNGVAALMATGESILESIGVESPWKVLGPLAAGSVANAVEGGGGSRTLTGPLVRGETATLRRHMESLDEDAVAAYRLTSLMILDAARRAGRIPDEVVAEMTDLLEG
jgi:predicted short-subunit dehydrogenase-like oxidoreductase (DUF2520 family)